MYLNTGAPVKYAIVERREARAIVILWLSADFGTPNLHAARQPQNNA